MREASPLILLFSNFTNTHDESQRQLTSEKYTRYTVVFISLTPKYVQWWARICMLNVPGIMRSHTTKYAGRTNSRYHYFFLNSECSFKSKIDLSKTVRVHGIERHRVRRYQASNTPSRRYSICLISGTDRDTPTPNIRKNMMYIFIHCKNLWKGYRDRSSFSPRAFVIWSECGLCCQPHLKRWGWVIRLFVCSFPGWGLCVLGKVDTEIKAALQSSRVSTYKMTVVNSPSFPLSNWSDWGIYGQPWVVCFESAYQYWGRHASSALTASSQSGSWQVNVLSHHFFPLRR